MPGSSRPLPDPPLPDRPLPPPAPSGASAGSDAPSAPTSPAPAPPAVTDVAGLVAAGLVATAQAPALEPVARAFRIRLTPAMQQAIRAPGGAGVAAQFLPDLRELAPDPAGLSDPIGDEARSPVPGLTHRYPDRVILHVTRSCAVYCRFCFRREVVGEEGMLDAGRLAEAIDYIARTPALREVILTGGDPLVLAPRRLGTVLGRIAAIRHLELLRIHSRIPLVAPERIDPAMLAALRPPGAPGAEAPPVWLVVHGNHPAELTAEARAALSRLADAGIPLLSQTVLLRGVNDDPDTLATLFRGFLRLRVKPYYLHHCDLARGAGHFRTTIAEGRAIMAALRGRISGTALPAYVLDLPGGHGKVPLEGGHVTTLGAGHHRIRDHQGRWHDYHDPARPDQAESTAAGITNTP